MTKVLLSEAPTALLAREELELRDVLSSSLMLTAFTSGFSRRDSYFFGKSGEEIEANPPELICYGDSKRIECIELAFKNNIDVVTSTIYLRYGLVRVKWKHYTHDEDELNLHLANLIEIDPPSSVHSITFRVLDSFWFRSVTRLERMFGDSNFKITASGIPVGKGDAKRQPLPRTVLSGMKPDENGTIRLPEEHMVGTDWSESLVKTNLGNTWRSVEVSFGSKSEPTRRDSRTARELKCTEQLLAMMRAAPLRPSRKATCERLMKGRIDNLSDREFDHAWHDAIRQARETDHETRWGQPGRPRQ
jgi:hypothetical protein